MIEARSSFKPIKEAVHSGAVCATGEEQGLIID